MESGRALSRLSLELGRIEEEEGTKADEARTGVRLDDWMRITRAVVDVFQRFGWTFTMAKSDLESNLEKITSHRDEEVWIEELLLSEKRKGTSREDPSATVAILWIRRSFHFLLVALEAYLPTSRKEDEGLLDVILTDALTRSYERTLKMYHGKVLYYVFRSSIALAPNSKTFFVKLGYLDPMRRILCVEDVERDLIQCTSLLRSLVERIASFFIEHDLENEDVI